MTVVEFLHPCAGDQRDSSALEFRVSQPDRFCLVTGQGGLAGIDQRLAAIEEIDYFSVADEHSLEELAIAATGAMVSVAVRMGQTRLIDNVILQ